MLALIFILGIFNISKASDKCPLKLSWQLEKVGMLNSRYLSGSTDFIFTSPDEMIVANFPPIGKDYAPVQVYRFTNGKWSYDQPSSSRLPKTIQPRQIIMDDLDNDGIKEVIIADHGIDRPPYPGARPIILKKDIKGWYADQSYLKITPAFTFSTAVIPMSDKSKALYFANVGYNTPILLRKNKKGEWDNLTKDLPPEIGTKVCLMTALKEDFDGNQVPDLFLGGCDRPDKRKEQTHDRLLIRMEGGWRFLPENLLMPRPRDSSWGTNFAAASDVNRDGKPDIIHAVHDFGFHEWELWTHINESKPWKFKFRSVRIPLKQELKTEGFLYGVEEIDVPGLGPFFLAQIRSVIRDKNKKDPELRARLFTFNGGKFHDYSSCLPEKMKQEYLNFKRFPDSKNKLLLLPFTGDIYQLSITRKP